MVTTVIVIDTKLTGKNTQFLETFPRELKVLKIVYKKPKIPVILITQSTFWRFHSLKILVNNDDMTGKISELFKSGKKKVILKTK